VPDPLRSKREGKLILQIDQSDNAFYLITPGRNEIVLPVLVVAFLAQIG
jgi:hypothetical protein